MDDTTLAALRTAAGALSDVGFAAMLGALATPALLRDGSSAWATRRLRRSRTLFGAATLLALVASLAWMAIEAVAMTDAPLPAALAEVGGIVTGTGFGRAWAVATAALVAALLLGRACRYRAFPLRSLGVLTVVVAAAHACMGHAAAAGLGWLVPAMAVHLLATGLWAGGVFGAALVVLRGEPDAIDGVRYARRLSTLATAALAGVVVTGGAIAWHGLGGTLASLVPVTVVAPTAGTDWAIALDAKLALVALAVALGGFNRFVVLPAMPRSCGRFARVLRLEAVVMVAVLVAAAWLAGGEPPAL